MSGMSEFPVTVSTFESGGVCVYHGVVRETVRSSKGLSTYSASEWLDSYEKQNKVFLYQDI